MLEYGRKLKRFLQERDVKQKDFAKKVGTHPITVNNSWIKKSKKPKRYNADKICDYTNGIISLKDMGYE